MGRNELMKIHKGRGLDTLSDEGLMQRVRDGEVEKLGLLFERYHMSLFN